MRTMGKGIVDVHAPQGFAAETTSAAAILASSHMGFGLSTTQVCSGSIIGSGVGKKLAHVRWATARKILYGWLLTLPAAALVGGAAAAIALTGTIGLIIVFAALLAGAGAIYADLQAGPGVQRERERLPRRDHQPGEGHGRRSDTRPTHPRHRERC